MRLMPEDRETYRIWKAELERYGKTPEDMVAHYKAIGMAEYAKKLETVISRMEESA